MRREALILVVVDLQEKLIPVIYNRDEVVENTKKLLKLAEVFSIPVILTEQYPKGLGRTIPEVEDLYNEIKTDKVKIEKLTFSCVREPSFTDLLSAKRKEGRGEVVVCGIEAHICVYQTCMDLKDMGYKVYLAGDAVGSRKEFNHRLILNYLVSRDIEVVPTETLIFELLERSDTPEFKSMLPYLK